MANCNWKGLQVPARMSSRLPLALFRCSRTLSPLLRPRLAFSMSSQSPAAGTEPEIPHFEFAEEPLGLPASEGFGYFQGRPGLVFGPDKRFKLQTKLGFGTTSSVWLARDSIRDTHVAIKILSGFATSLNRERKLRELEVLQRLSSPKDSSDPSSRCVRLLDHFYYPGIEEDGEHLCLVTELFWSNVQAFQDADTEFIPITSLKRMLRHLLLGIAHSHERGIAHTVHPLPDIKPDNIMIELGPFWTTEAIDKWLAENPPRTYPPERSLNKMVSVLISHFFPPPTLDQIQFCNFKLADFSSDDVKLFHPATNTVAAQIVSDQTTDDITPLGLRAPEVVLGGEWNESVDIWTFGCMVFTLLTKVPLFEPMVAEEYNASEVDVLLYQMILFCGEFFQPDLLRRCSRSIDYFERDCSPRKFTSFPRKTFEECILSTGRPLSPEDMAGVTDLMTRCLRLDPKNRATAQELLTHPWLAQTKST
ncbi:hypothetical protein CVT26_003021 [Gymnopilus dilepis]|uniref:non-specific serine/threonine protein kinase n=1 Tax=Gymnopilus dilepis TaxID=231916 RepID=A0A409W2L9_9AGAR|nr:hypothetical protein CVT26_003021 [Gymnopilus dilepis]